MALQDLDHASLGKGRHTKKVHYEDAADSDSSDSEPEQVQKPLSAAPAKSGAPVSRELMGLQHFDAVSEFLNFKTNASVSEREFNLDAFCGTSKKGYCNGVAVVEFSSGCFSADYFIKST